MLNKYFLYLLMCFICLSIEYDIVELQECEQITVNKETYFYINIDGLDIYSEVNIELKFDDGYDDDSIELKYKFSNYHDESDYWYYFNPTSNVSYSDSEESFTYDFIIYIYTNTSYLLLKFPYDYEKMTIKYSKKTEHKINIFFIFMILVAILFLISVIVHIIYCKPVKSKIVFLLPNTLTEENYS